MGINAYPTDSLVDFDEIKSSIFNDYETQVRLFQHLTGWELSPTRSGYGSTRGKEPSSLTAYACSSNPEKLIFKRWSRKSEPINGGDIIEWTKHQRHCDFQGAMTYLGDQVGVTIKQTSPPPRCLIISALSTCIKMRMELMY